MRHRIGTVKRFNYFTKRNRYPTGMAINSVIWIYVIMSLREGENDKNRKLHTPNWKCRGRMSCRMNEPWKLCVKPCKYSQMKHKTVKQDKI